MKSTLRDLTFFFLLTLFPILWVGQGLCFASGYDRLSQGLTAYKASRFQEARDELTAALAQLPHDSVLRPVAELYLGKALMEQQRYGESVGHFRTYTRWRPKDAQGFLLYANALLFSGQNEESIEALDQAAGKNRGTAVSAAYLSGVAHARLERFSEAKKLLEITAKASPDSMEGQSARQILAVLPPDSDAGNRRTASGQPPRWELFATANTGYDSNVALMPDGSALLPDQFSDQDAWGVGFGVGGGYHFDMPGRHRAGIYASYAGIRRDDLEQFDSDQIALNPYWEVHHGTGVFRLNAIVAQDWVDHDEYSFQYRIVPGLSWQVRDWTWTDLDLSLGQADYLKDPPMAEEDRDNTACALSVAQNFAIENAILDGYLTFFALGGSIGASDADGSSYDHWSLGPDLVAVQTLPGSVRVQVQGSLQYKSYDNPDARSIAGQSREDTLMSLSARLVKSLENGVSIFFAYAYRSNDSNIAEYYEYNTEIYTAGLRVEFDSKTAPW